MKYINAVFIFIAILFFPTGVHAEAITDFQAGIVINADGSFAVDERISYDFGSNEKHGIYRTIPFTKTNTDGKKFVLTLADFSVVDENSSPYRFSESRSSDDVTLKIGDPDNTVTGSHIYTVKYMVGGGLTYFSDHDELYWNVTGNDWTVPIEHVTVTASLPESVSDGLTVACFTGIKGSDQKNCTAAIIGGKAAVTTDSLSSGEGLTIVFGFPKNIVSVLEPKEVNTFWSDLSGKIISFLFVIGSIIWYLLLPIWVVFRWWRHGRDPKSPIGIAHAWFAAPKTDKGRDLTPGETGTLVDEQADIKDITATLVDLARRGYLKIIEKTKNDFYLEKQSKGKVSQCEPFEKTLLDGIFEDGTMIRIKDGSFVTTVTKTKNQLYEAVVREKFFVENPNSVRTRYTILGAVALFTMNIPLALAAFIFGRAMPKKTVEGVSVGNVALALKNFIVTQDRQFAYQAKKQIFFEKFLPYAIVFGVEKIWAQRFAAIDLSAPDWYEGSSMRTFNSILFVNALNHSMQSFTSAATPTSSSSGFSSGFSGGSSGGGGGGGGGGSW